MRAFRADFLRFVCADFLLFHRFSCFLIFRKRIFYAVSALFQLLVLFFCLISAQMNEKSYIKIRISCYKGGTALIYKGILEKIIENADFLRKINAPPALRWPAPGENPQMDQAVILPAPSIAAAASTASTAGKTGQNAAQSAAKTPITELTH